MNVTLSPHLEEMVRRQVGEGKYGSPNEVVAEGLRLLEELDVSEHARLVALQRDIARAAEQADNGDTVEADIVFAQLKARNARINTDKVTAQPRDSSGGIQRA